MVRASSVSALPSCCKCNRWLPKSNSLRLGNRAVRLIGIAPEFKPPRLQKGFLTGRALLDKRLGLSTGNDFCPKAFKYVITAGMIPVIMRVNGVANGLVAIRQGRNGSDQAFGRGPR